MRIIKNCLIAGLFLATTLPLFSGEPDNLIQNPGMEAGALAVKNLPADWETVSFPGLETVYQAEWSEKAYQGKKSLALAWISGGARIAAIPVLRGRIKGGRSYQISGFCLTDCKGEAGFAFETFDQGGKLLQAGQSPKKVTPTNAWFFLEWPFTTHAETIRLKVYLMNTGEGKAWFDEIVLQESAGGMQTAEDFPIKYSLEPVDGNIFWNDNRKVFHSLAESPVSLSICFWGEKQKVTDPRIIFEVPAGIAIPEIYSQRRGLDVPYLAPIKPESFTTAEVFRGQKRYLRYTVSNPHALNFRYPTMSHADLLTLCFTADKHDPDQEHEIFWHLENGAQAAPEEHFTLKILPPLQPTPNPKKFKGLGFEMGDINYYDPGLLKKVLSKYEEANIHGRSRIDPHHELGALGKHIHDVDQVLKARGWTLFSAIMTVLCKMEGDRGMVNKKGEESTRFVCPTCFLTQPRSQDEFKKLLATEDLYYLEDGELCCIDFEPWQWPKEYCFCEKCLDNFAKRYGLDRQKLATPEIILKDYRQEWADYWVFLVSEIYRQVTGIIRGLNPTWRIIDYDYLFWYENDRLFAGWDRSRAADKTLLEIPKDPRRYEQYLDLHWLSVYHNNGKDAFELIANNTQVLKKPAWIMPAISRSRGVTGAYTKPHEALTPQQFKLKIIAGAASGAKSLGIYPGEHIDGMYFKTIDQAMAEIAQFEDFYFQGARQDTRVRLKGFPDAVRKEVIKGQALMHPAPDWNEYLGVRAHALKGETLLTLCNFNADSDAYLRISLAQAANDELTVLAPISRQIIAKSRKEPCWTARDLEEGFWCLAPKNAATYLLIRKHQRRDRKLEKIYQEDLIAADGNRIKKENQNDD